MLKRVDTQTSIDEVQHYICNRLDESLKRQRLANVAGFSVPHLHRIFIAGTGVSIAAYIRRVRLYRAGLKLRMGAVDITEVALAAGYSSHAAFGKAFKRQYGLSPSEFRALNCAVSTQILRKVKPL